jgi:hypothetical protein
MDKWNVYMQVILFQLIRNETWQNLFEGYLSEPKSLSFCISCMHRETALDS